MRYLFRGLKAYGKKGMVYGKGIKYGKNYSAKEKKQIEQVYIMDDDYWWAEVIPETVGQWTGLKDKNDVNIYEGDRVKIENENESGVIEYSGSSFIISCCHGCYFDWMESEVEVIGNIHEG